jgi:hypothetical protein
VPGPDGALGLPFVNWSVDGGDLRVAHFIGLHALQGLPLLGYVLDQRRRLTTTCRRTAVGSVAAVWVAAMGLALLSALRGQPLLAP